MMRRKVVVVGAASPLLLTNTRANVSHATKSAFIGDVQESTSSIRSGASLWWTSLVNNRRYSFLKSGGVFFSKNSGTDSNSRSSKKSDDLFRSIWNNDSSKKKGEKSKNAGGGGDDDENSAKDSGDDGEKVMRMYFLGTLATLGLTGVFYWLACPSGPNISWESAAEHGSKITHIHLYDNHVQFWYEGGQGAHVGVTGSSMRTDQLIKKHLSANMPKDVTVSYYGTTYSEMILHGLGTFLWLLPILFFPVYSVGMARLVSSAPAQQQGNSAKAFSKKMFAVSKKTDVRFKDIAGMHEAKSEVKEVVDFLKNPEPYAKLGAKIPSGALLLGPPGTGKTLLAKAVAGEADVSFIPTNGSDFVELYVGMGALRVRQLFELAKKQDGRVIIYIDEIDAIGLKRRGAGHGEKQEQEHTLNELLTQLDGFGTEENKVLVLASSNVAQDMLDPALIRPGRFDRIVHVDAPVLKERREIFEVHLDKLKLLEPPAGYTEKMEMEAEAEKMTNLVLSSLNKILPETDLGKSIGTAEGEKQDKKPVKNSDDEVKSTETVQIPKENLQVLRSDEVPSAVKDAASMEGATPEQVKAAEDLVKKLQAELGDNVEVQLKGISVAAPVAESTTTSSTATSSPSKSTEDKPSETNEKTTVSVETVTLKEEGKADISEEMKVEKKVDDESSPSTSTEKGNQDQEVEDSSKLASRMEGKEETKDTEEEKDAFEEFKEKKATMVKEYAHRMSDLCPGFVGADISNICNEAAILAARQNDETVTIDHLEKSIDRVLAGIEMRSRVLSDFEKEVVAHHEAGHAIAGWYLNRADPLMKVSIVPRGGKALGYAQYLPSENNLKSGNDIIDSMCVALGGRVAEAIYYNHLSTGASDDLMKTTRMAYQYVASFQANGVATVPPGRSTSYRKPFGHQTADRLDDASKKLVDDAYAKTMKLLTERKEEMTKLAQHLLKHEVLTHQDVVDYLGKREERKPDFRIA